MSALTASVARFRRLRRARFWLGLAMLSAVLPIDDLFVLHEHVAPVHLGLHERATVAAYAVAGGAIVGAHRGYVRALPWLLGALALVFFSVLLAVDDLYPGGEHFRVDALARGGGEAAAKCLENTVTRDVGPLECFLLTCLVGAGARRAAATARAADAEC